MYCIYYISSVLICICTINKDYYYYNTILLFTVFTDIKYKTLHSRKNNKTDYLYGVHVIPNRTGFVLQVSLSDYQYILLGLLVS